VAGVRRIDRRHRDTKRRSLNRFGPQGDLASCRHEFEKGHCAALL
jgi:hypothetical protein